ncbi:MAG: hypothetical protein EA417_15885 [Gammaproteobacteria bacterium]|nr:MAG: hypothetical protein EA417_15885 [Gammaproteobacteria bacterium]
MRSRPHDDAERQSRRYQVVRDRWRLAGWIVAITFALVLYALSWLPELRLYEVKGAVEVAEQGVSGVAVSRVSDRWRR